MSYKGKELTPCKHLGFGPEPKDKRMPRNRACRQGKEIGLLMTCYSCKASKSCYEVSEAY